MRDSSVTHAMVGPGGKRRVTPGIGAGDVHEMRLVEDGGIAIGGCQEQDDLGPRGNRIPARDLDLGDGGPVGVLPGASREPGHR